MFLYAKLLFAPAGAGKRLRHSRCIIGKNITVAIRNMMSQQHHISTILFDNTRKTRCLADVFRRATGMFALIIIREREAVMAAAPSRQTII